MSSLKNALLTRYDSGFRTDTDSTSISANGRREAFVALSNVRSNANSDTIVAAYLAAFKSGVTTILSQKIGLLRLMMLILAYYPTISASGKLKASGLK